MNVLFLNHKIKNCGVYQYGKRLVEILQKDTQINYIYKELDSHQEYITILTENMGSLDAIIYNYHGSTMSWLKPTNIQKVVKNIGIPHESPEYLFDIICNIDPTRPEQEGTNRFSLPRPIYENVDELIETPNPNPNPNITNFINKYTNTNVPIFGSFGFGFENKGFDKIVTYVCEQYDSAIIKMVIPVAHFDPNPNTVNVAREKCIAAKNINKPNIILIITHEFFSTADILKFLRSNTMNIFMYDKMLDRGISSTVDYALSVKKPIGISDSHMFKNIYSDDICLYKTPIREILKNSQATIDKYCDEYSNEKMRTVFRTILGKK
jgi:hypothetical protein